MSVQILRESIQRYIQAKELAIETCKHEGDRPCKECISRHLDLLRPEYLRDTPKPKNDRASDTAQKGDEE